MIEIEGPDGVIYEFPEGTDQATMASAMQQVYGAPAQPQQPQGNTAASLIGQAGAGSQEGIASMLGFPVDAVADAIGGVGQLTGLWDRPQNPVGGSEFWSGVMEPTRAGIGEPTTDAERFVRRAGEEIGAGAVGAPIALASAAGRAAPVAAALTDLAASGGAGLGAAVADYFAPDSTAAEIAGLLAGGLTAGNAASRYAGLGGTDDVVRSGIDEQRRIANDAYDVVRADQSLISADPVVQALNDVSQREGLNRRLQPVSSNIRRAVNEDLGMRGNMAGPTAPVRVEDIENMRRVINGSVSPATTAPADQRIAGLMKDEITSYLDSLDTPATRALTEGRDATRRYKAAESLEAASTKAARRAASTGSGGNEINAMRQNLRGILDNPNKARSFSPAERQMMEKVVMGDGGSNMARSLSRFAPSSGGLSSMLGIGGVMASPAVALPIMAVTEGAKIAGERMTRGGIDELLQSIAPSRVTQVGEQGIDPVIRALLGLRAVEEGGN